jgi:hypothetical protein
MTLNQKHQTQKHQTDAIPPLKPLPSYLPGPVNRETFVKALHWYNGPARKIFGPEPGALIPLNLLAAVFSHSHSDAAMRMLHGYTSIGLIPGLLAALYLFQKKRHWVFPLILLPINGAFLGVNIWISINSMGIPYGSYFHVSSALLILVNFFTITQLEQ